jgi:hypothetical protein
VSWARVPAKYLIRPILPRKMNQNGMRTCGSEWHFYLFVLSSIKFFCRLGPLSPNDKFTFRVESQLGAVPVLGRSTTIAATNPYTVDSLLVMQGKQGPNGSTSSHLHGPGLSNTTLLIRYQATTEFPGERPRQRGCGVDNQSPETLITGGRNVGRDICHGT